MGQNFQNNDLDQIWDKLQQIYTTGIGGGTVTVNRYGRNGYNVGNFTRPNDTTAYAANDSINSSTTNSGTNAILNIFNSNYGGTLQSFWLWTNKAGITPRIRVFVFPAYISNIGASIFDDNTAFAPTDSFFSASSTFQFYFDLPAMSASSGFSGGSYAIATNLSMPQISSDESFYFHLQTLDAFTPNANQIFRYGVTSQQN